VLGIALVSVGAVLHGDPKTGDAVSLSGAATTDIVLNHAFEGLISVDTSERPGLESLPRGLQEFGEPPAAQQKVGRKEPCWCGSGRKFKRCHGA
jgi:hypothetical protein